MIQIRQSAEQVEIRCTYCGLEIHNNKERVTRCSDCAEKHHGSYCSFCGKKDYSCEYCKDNPRPQVLSNEELLNRIERLENCLVRLIKTKNAPYDILKQETLDLIKEVEPRIK